MPVDGFNRLTSQGGRPVPEMGSTTPGIERSESERPAVGLLPAPYLPVARFDDHKRANIVLSAGTPVALDTAGNLIPAGITRGHQFTYSALDFATGLPPTRRADTGAVVISGGTVTIHSGLLAVADSGHYVPPIGVVSYNVFQHEGGVTITTWPAYTLNHDNPTQFQVHNTMAQDLVAITCDYVLECPYLSGNVLSGGYKIFDNTALEVAALSNTAKSYPFAHEPSGLVIRPGDMIMARAGKFCRYDDVNPTDIIGQVLRVDRDPIKKDYLDRVRTAYTRSATVAHHMAGSATRGVPYLLHLVTDGAQIQLETKKTLSGDTLNATGMPTSLPLAAVVINLQK